MKHDFENQLVLFHSEDFLILRGCQEKFSKVPKFHIAPHTFHPSYKLDVYYKSLHLEFSSSSNMTKKLAIFSSVGPLIFQKVPKVFSILIYLQIGTHFAL